MISPGHSRRTLMAFRKTHQHKCAHHHCAEQIGTGMLMCRTHWFALPARLREGINSALEQCKRAGIEHSDALIALRKQAIDYHQQQPELLA